MMFSKISLQCFALIFCSITHLSFGDQKVEVISIDATRGQNLNLSEIAETIEMVDLEPTQGHNLNAMGNLVLTEDYIFISMMLKVEGKDRSNILQYDRKGNFIRQLGDGFEGWISIIHDPIRKTVGANNGEKSFLYDYQGRMVEEAKTFTQNQIYFNDHYWGVQHESSAGQKKYTLKRGGLDGSNIKELFDFYDKTQSVVGHYIRFSVVGNRLYFWDNFSKMFYEVKDQKAQPRFELRMNKDLNPRVSTKIVGEWIIIPARDQKRNINLHKLVNLSSGKAYSVSDRMSNGKQRSGFLDDISGAGFLRLHDTGPVYGALDNKLVFRKKRGDVPQLANSPYSGDSPVIFIVTLK